MTPLSDVRSRLTTPLSRVRSRLQLCASITLSGALLACSGTSATDAGPATPTGTLSVTVTGLPTGTTSAGSVTVNRTDVSGHAPLAIVIANAGSNGATVETQVGVGAYAIVYSAPSGYMLAAGASNVQAAVIGQAGDSAGVTFVVTPLAPPPPITTYDGFWSGTTSDGATISFTVADTVVSNISVPFRLTGNCGVGGVTITVNGTVGFVSGQTLNVGEPTTVLFVLGSFTSSTQATGSASTLYQTVSPPGGTCTGSNTWVARRQ